MLYLEPPKPPLKQSPKLYIPMPDSVAYVGTSFRVSSGTLLGGFRRSITGLHRWKSSGKTRPALKAALPQGAFETLPGAAQGEPTLGGALTGGFGALSSGAQKPRKSPWSVFNSRGSRLGGPTLLPLLKYISDTYDS